MSEQPQYQPPADSTPADTIGAADAYNFDRSDATPAHWAQATAAYAGVELPEDRAKPISEARAALPNPDDRQTSRPDNIRQPQDRKKSKLRLRAERDAKLDADGKLPFDYDGTTYRFDPDLLNVRFQLMCEDGNVASAVRYLMGKEAFEPLMDAGIDELEGILKAIGEVNAAGNS